MRQIWRRRRDVGRPRVALEKLLGPLMIHIRAHRPEEVPEASSLATSRLHQAVLRQHRCTFLRRRGRTRRVAATLVMLHQAARRGFHTLGRRAGHPVVGSPSEQRGEAHVAPRRRCPRRRRRRRRRRLAGQREVRRIICEHADQTVAVCKLNPQGAACLRDLAGNYRKLGQSRNPRRHYGADRRVEESTREEPNCVKFQHMSITLGEVRLTHLTRGTSFPFFFLFWSLGLDPCVCQGNEQDSDLESTST